MAYGFPKWMDGGFNIPLPVSLPVLTSPIPATTAQYTLTQDWMVHINSFAPLALNLPHPNPDFKDFLLVTEGPREDQGGGIVRWRRTYAKVPDTYDEYESFAYTFIGFAIGGDANSLNAPGRNRETFVVQSRLRYEFFLTGIGTINPIDGRIYTTAADIPLLQPLSYWLVDQQFPVRNPTPWTTDLIEDSPPYTQPTSPRLTSYRTWINNAQRYGFNGDVVNGFDPEADNPANGKNKWTNLINPSQFPVEQSVLKRWMGNIYVRTTRTILAR